ncbi:hypothetical protein [Prosthecochloris sp. HL-130-GSB]|uniref:hypothetical protein n=1 Tax=Prosthecochloris sp. HL-130-GSB TaxID=1974213 RepID=UPI0012F517C9|nr:hypothetical protein [Prosthecochloris sp. HL-130-GSB]
MTSDECTLSRAGGRRREDGDRIAPAARSPFTIHHSPFTIHHSPFTIHHSLVTIST